MTDLNMTDLKTTDSRIMERQHVHDASAFPLMKLPRELRDHVYRLMVTPVLRYRGLATEKKALFDTAILRTNKQVRTEASAAVAETKVTILVVLEQLYPQSGSWREYRGLDYYLALLPFKRYSIDFDFTDQTTYAYATWRMGHDQCMRCMQHRIHNVAKALSNTAHLVQLHINCSIPQSEPSQNHDENPEQGHRPGLLPNQMMDCFSSSEAFKTL